jgi:hypothetical protein
VNPKRHEVVHCIVRDCYIAENTSYCKFINGYPTHIRERPVPRASFSDSGTVSNPKWVVLSWFEDREGDSARRVELESHCCDCAREQLGLEARNKGLRADFEAIIVEKGHGDSLFPQANDLEIF